MNYTEMLLYPKDMQPGDLILMNGQWVRIMTFSQSDAASRAILFEVQGDDQSIYETSRKRDMTWTVRRPWKET